SRFQMANMTAMTPANFHLLPLERTQLMPTCNCTLVEMSETFLMIFYVSYIIIHLIVLAGFFFFGHLIFKETNRTTVIIPLPSTDIATEMESSHAQEEMLSKRKKFF
ncbi:hypothetical protein PFISCL1PPCAC_3036, partial [Pristionchus fissidentatus]